MRQALGGATAPMYHLAIPRGMFKLAIPRGMFKLVIQRLAKSGCDRGASVIVEKPFGRDVASARALNARALLKRNEGESHDY